MHQMTDSQSMHLLCQNIGHVNNELKKVYVCFPADSCRVYCPQSEHCHLLVGHTQQVQEETGSPPLSLSLSLTSLWLLM